MITTREARLAAEAWIREEAGRHPELVGAILAGSTKARAPDEPHPPSLDVDLFIYVDAEVPSEILESDPAQPFVCLRLLTQVEIQGGDLVSVRSWLRKLALQTLEPSELERCQQLLAQHHYLGSPKPAGERLYYVVTDTQGQWLALLIFAAAAKHLRDRDRWIGWTDAQRERRLSLVVNNTRFLVLLDKAFPNLPTESLRLVLARLSQDWQDRYVCRPLATSQVRKPT